MKKLVLSIFAVCAISVASFAQGRFSAGLELGFPMGDFADLSGMGIGISGRYEAGINENLNWMGTIGYLSFAEKDDIGAKVSIIPIQAGLKYYFTESFNGFYAGAELGFNMVKVEIDNDFFEGSESETEFGFAPTIGYHLGNLDFGARYQIINDADFFGIRAAYVFGSAE